MSNMTLKSNTGQQRSTQHTLTIQFMQHATTGANTTHTNTPNQHETTSAHHATQTT